MKHKKKHKKNFTIIIVLLIAAVVIFGISKVRRAEYVQHVSPDDPVDVAIDFYGSWLNAVTATNTDPHKLDLDSEPILSKTLSAQLSSVQSGQEVDPVLCQTVPPTQITSRRVYENKDSVQILVISKEPPQAGQTTLTLSSLRDGWYIEDIQCSQGETAAQREFDFEAEGILLKNLEPSIESDRWHFAFTRNDIQVETVPLFFNTDSICVDKSGEELVCDSTKLVDTRKVLLQGAMSEAGVEVQRITEK